MDSFKAWMTTKVKTIEQNATEVTSKFANVRVNVMTPRTIPEFVIPHFQAEHAPCSGEGTNSDHSSDRSSPMISPDNSNLSIASLCRSPTSRSCPVTPIPHRGVERCDSIEHKSFSSTDSFPSMMLNLGGRDAARTAHPPPLTRHESKTSPVCSPQHLHCPPPMMINSSSSDSLTHKTCTPSPDPASTVQLKPMRHRLNFRSRSAGEPGSLDLRRPVLRRCSPHRSPSASPAGSPRPARKLPQPPITKRRGNPAKVYLRRRSSLTSYDEKLYLACRDPNAFPTSDSLESATEDEDDDDDRSLPSLSPSFGKSQSHHSHLSDSSCQSRMTVATIATGKAELGQLKLSMQYLPGSKQLKVVLLKGENLGGAAKTHHQMNSFVKLYLVPGKMQKRSSKVVKNTKGPTFNEDFHFLDLELESMPQMQLKLKVLNKSHHLIKPEVIGDVHVKLDPLELTSECRMWKALKSTTATQDLGQIQLSMRLEPQAERLTITLSKAKDLPKNASGQTPNAQVKISVMQRTKQQTKESRVKKRSCHPSWKEAFSFLINVDPENLHYYTSVTVTIHDPEIGGESGVIGQVRFGQGAVQNSEIAHWKKVLQSMRKESTEWHRLMVCEDERD